MQAYVVLINKYLFLCEISEREIFKKHKIPWIIHLWVSLFTLFAKRLLVALLALNRLLAGKRSQDAVSLKCS